MTFACASAKKSDDTSKASQANSSSSKNESKTKSGSNAEKSSSKNVTRTVNCNLDQDKRKIEKVKTTGDHVCEVQYTKWNKTRVMGTAANDETYCDELVDRIKGNLEGASFSCQ